VKALILLPVVLTTSLAGLSGQDDWSDGPGVPGPVNFFFQSFDSHQNMGYEDTPGELFLHLRGEKHQVTNYLEYSVPGMVADMNGDGHLDVVCGSNGYSKRKVYWFENDGSGGGWERHDVSGTGEVTYPWSVCAADVDGDGDMDVICGDNDNKILLWINTDGSGLTWETIILVDNLFYSPTFVTNSDIDGDSYPDVVTLTGGGSNELILWFENPIPDRPTIDGWTQHLVGPKANCNQVFPADINGDGRMDVVSAAGSSNKQVSWWENENGTGDNWTERTIVNNINHAKTVHASDMDGDGDMDVIAAGSYDLYWFENDDGLGTSWTEHQLPDPFVLCKAAAGVDIFGNGSPVILSAHGSSGTPIRFVLWERMDEGGLTWRRHILEKSYLYHGLSVGDIDGDGTLDVVAFEDGSRVFWFSKFGYPSEGTLTSSILDVNNYPHWDEIQWQDSVPAGSSVRFRVRSSNDPGDMGEWSGYIEESGSLEGFADSTHRYFQYRVHMEPSGHLVTPTLYQVLIYWQWLGVEGAEEETCLHPVTPNPCTGPVEIRFSLAEPGPIALQVFDLYGRLVALPVDGEVSGGEHSVQLASLHPGAYFVRMTTGEEVLRERFVLVGDQ